MVKTGKLVICVIAAAVFTAIGLFLITSLMAEVDKGVAIRMESAYNWKGAEIKFRNAIRLSPLNSDYPALLGDLFMKEAFYADNKLPFLTIAGTLYERAIKLNPRNPEHYLKMGIHELDMFRNGAGLSHKEKAFRYFRKAVEYDPNGFNISYSIGWAGIVAMDALDPDETEFIMEALRHSFVQRPWELEKFYNRMWPRNGDFSILERATPEDSESFQVLHKFLEKNNLWQFHKKVSDRILFYKKKENPEKFQIEQKEKKKKAEELKKVFFGQKAQPVMDAISVDKWKGESEDGRYKIKDGVMYWNGTIYVPLIMKPGPAAISVEAKKLLVINAADPDDHRFSPYMIVTLDGEEVGGSFVDNNEFKPFTFLVSTEGGEKIIGVTFVNDIYDVTKGEDRNLAVQNASITYE